MDKIQFYIQASLFGLLVCTAQLTYLVASLPIIHRTGKGKIWLGLGIALVSVAVPLCFHFGNSAASEQWPTLWFSLVLGPVAANFIHEGICKRAEEMQNLFDDSSSFKLGTLKARLSTRKNRLARFEKEKAECVKNVTPHDTYIEPKVKQLNELIIDLEIDIEDLEDEIKKVERRRHRNKNVPESNDGSSEPN